MNNHYAVVFAILLLVLVVAPSLHFYGGDGNYRYRRYNYGTVLLVVILGVLLITGHL